MIGASMTAWAIEALFASAVLVALVMLVRVPVRRAFGPAVAYALWALPALRLVLPPLPEGLGRAAAAPFAAASERVIVLLLPPAAPEAAPPVLGIAAVALWGAGALAFVAWQLLAYARFVGQVRRTGTTVGRVGRVAVIASEAVTDPLAFGLVRPVVAVPRDFAERYDAAERGFALAHELAHHRRGDVLANWAALGCLAAHWFNPLAWAALRAFRTDQEMANDAHVLASSPPASRYTYACALLKAAGMRAPAAACGLHTINDLKGRLRMLNQSTSRRRRALGAAAIATATIGLLGFTASGSEAASTMRARVEKATGVPLASLDPTALFQAEPADSGPDAPPAPPGPTAPGSGGRHVHAVRDGRSTHVTVTEDGRTREMDGAEAEAWLAANPPPPAPVPPVPPVPPVAGVAPVPPVPPAPPAPPAPHTAMKVIVRDRYGDVRSREFGALLRPGDVPRVESLDCPDAAGDRRLVLDERRGGQRRVIICTNRVAAAAAEAQQAARAAVVASGQAEAARREGLRSALQGLRATRESMAAHRDMADWERKEVLQTIDRSIRRVEEQLGAAS